MDARQQLQAALGSAYTVERELGGGGMSRVFVAEENALRRKVVVKVLPTELFAGVSLERFNREILVAARLQHPHIVPVLAAGEMNGIPYYTMPFVEGESLRARLARGVAVPITEVVALLRDVAKALAYAHERGIVHRDIKPDNVLVTGGSATVTDFGIAKAISASRTHDGDATLTQAGASIGTPAYMAPEQAAGDPRTDHRADIYAFGCMAYELLAGRPPFLQRTPQHLLAAHMGATPESVAALRVDTPGDLAALVMRCLEKEADRRPQQATELVRALETVTGGDAQPGMQGILSAGPRSLAKALALYAATFLGVALAARAAIVSLGLPDWVMSGALVVMALGLPAVLLTAYVQRITRLATTVRPTHTPGGTLSIQQGTMESLALKASPHMSWRRTTMGGVAALIGLVVVVAAFMTLRAYGIGPFGSLLGRGSLSPSDRILVADFRASADSALGDVVSEALRTKLSQSRAIGVVSAAGIGDALRRMEKPANAHFDVPLARELAEREGVKGIVHGEVVSAGAGFIITARLVAAASGDELTNLREAAKDATDIIPAIDRLGRELRARIGESLKSVRDAAPLWKVTTASMPALRKYSEGMSLHYRQAQYGKAAEAFEEATRLDSTFGMAYMRAGLSYNNAATNVTRRDSMRARSFRLRDRLPPLERALVEGVHYDAILRRDSAIAAHERALAIDSNQTFVLNVLGNLYRSQREPARAERLYRRAIALKDGGGQASANIVWALLEQGKVAEAKVQIAETRKQFPAFKSAPLAGGAAIAMMEARYDSVEKLLDLSSRSEASSIARAAGTNLANVRQTRGRLVASAHLRDSLFARDRAAENLGNERSRRFNLALDSIHMENWVREHHTEAAVRLDALLASEESRGGPAPLALLAAAREYAWAGQPQKARVLVDRFDREVHDTIALRSASSLRPWTEGEIKLAERRYQEAISQIRRSDLLYDGRPHNCGLCTQVLLARAFDLAGMADSAIVAFERFVAGTALRFATDADYLAGAYKRLGELYEAKGDLQKAAEYYGKFIALWKDADPDLQPKVAEVRLRLARMRDQERRR